MTGLCLRGKAAVRCMIVAFTCWIFPGAKLKSIPAGIRNAINREVGDCGGVAFEGKCQPQELF